MNARTIRSIAIVCAFGVMSLTAIVSANDVGPGSDVFTTPPGGAVLRLGTTPGGLPSLPADFFGPGSDPFTGDVTLVGRAFQDPIGNGDTVVERLQATTGMEVGGCADAPIDIELVALSLESITPITVQFDGGASTKEFDVFVEVSPVLPSVGTMQICHETEDGGTYTASMNIYAKATFTDVADPLNESVLDAGELDPPVSELLFCDALGLWSHTQPVGHVGGSEDFHVIEVCPHEGPHPDSEPAIIPTVSEWGLIILGLLFLTGGTIAIRRWRRPAEA